jgi:hypothetical protein
LGPFSFKKKFDTTLPFLAQKYSGVGVAAANAATAPKKATTATDKRTTTPRSVCCLAGRILTGSPPLHGWVAAAGWIPIKSSYPRVPRVQLSAYFSASGTNG